MTLFVVTGYSRFPGCPENPTERLVNRLKEELSKRGVKAVVCKVLPVSAEFVDKWLVETARELSPSQPIVWVHFGVENKAEHFKLEAQAYNEATFREPDEDGWQPQHEPIDTHPGCSPDTCLHTRLPLQRVLDNLQTLGHDVQISHSAGRYLCNYIYFRSLQHCTNVPNWHALFVHVPPLKYASEEAELAFSLDLFDQLAHQVKASLPLNQIALR
ncbi:hypothetical protein WJX79_003597 [Trebouxia sp. C0005]|nr:MAG: hypothetical protein FRX49_09834 [Trebouxia sp. A1-2]